MIILRKVELNMDENNKYEVIKKLVDSKGNKKKASLKLGLSIRQINRMIKGYLSQGKSFFLHGNRGRKPVITIHEDVKCMVIDLYKNKYYDGNFKHFNELLAEHEGINISDSSVKNILKSENIISPKARRETKRNAKKALEEKLLNTNLSDSQKTIVLQNIIDIEGAHPRRPRSAYFGEMIQMDASLHNWFGNFKCQLHIGIDDSTGTIVGAYFDEQETLKGYYNVLYQILKEYGIPHMFFTDRRTVFEYKRKGSEAVEDDTFTQFGYACKQLGIEIKTSSVAQAKGRVERLFETLQSRLILEMRLSGITTIEEANEFLNLYVKKFNKAFALPINYSKSVFEEQPSDSDINLKLAVLVERKIDTGHCIRFDKKYYKTIDENNTPVYHKKGAIALVIRAFDGGLFANVNDKIYALNEVPIRETLSKNFDIIAEKPATKKIYIPPMSHPWKRSSFIKFANKQLHREQLQEVS